MEDWNGKFELIDPRVIVVDHRYQREEKDNLIATIAKAPNWAAFGAISCYRRDGVVVCVDGQQRLKGVLASEDPPNKVPCVIHPKSTLEREAQTFVDMNITRTAVTSLEKHKGLVVAKNPAALAIERAVETAGFSLGGGNTTGQAKNISAVGSVYHVYNLLGEEGLVQVLVQIRDSWPNDPAGLGVNILRGVCDVMVDLGAEYQRAKLTTALSKTSPNLILRKTAEFQFDMGGSKQKNVRRAIKALCKV